MIKALILGIIQGISEFLPISSSGHLVVFGEYLNMSMPGNTLEIMLHVGTLFSVIVCFREKIFLLIKDFFGLFKSNYKSSFNTKTNFVVLLIIASIPAAVIGLLLDSYLEKVFESVLFVGFALLLTGIILFISTKIKIGTKTMEDITIKDAIFIGIAQSIAVVPGISRSGMSITAGLFKNLDRKNAAEWSFLMSLPVIAGAAILKIPSLLRVTDLNYANLFVGIISSFIFGILAIKILLKVIQSDKWKYFSYYCLIVGTVLIAINI